MANNISEDAINELRLREIVKIIDPYFSLALVKSVIGG